MLRTSVLAAVSVLSLFAVTGCSKKAEAAGRDGTKLSLSDPADQTITQGTTDKVSISIDRAGFAEPVQITFSNLPAGVRVDESTIPAGDSKRDFVLIAAPDAQVVNKQLVTVNARAQGANASQTFELTVKAK
jgi:hypothetical protein